MTSWDVYICIYLYICVYIHIYVFIPVDVADHPPGRSERYYKPKERETSYTDLTDIFIWVDRKQT